MKQLLLIVTLFFTFGLDSSSHAANFLSRFYGAGCQARWDKCVGWVQSNCAKNTGGCNGSCVFGIRGDCEVDDLQAMGSASASQSRDSRPVAQNQRTISQPSKKYQDLTQDRSAVKADGSYELIEKGQMKTMKLSPIEARSIGISMEPAVVERPQYKVDQRSY